MKGIYILKKFKIKKKFFKKNKLLLKNINVYKHYNTILLKSFFILYFYKKLNLITDNKSYPRENIYINISQKLHNPKGVLYINKNLNTISIGSIIKYFNIFENKFIRRTLKGNKIFLNFLKNIVNKKYSKLIKNNNLLLTINGFDYNLFYYKYILKGFFKKSDFLLFFLINLKINFNKKKEKKIKAIKKRLKKKILLNFTKDIKKRI